MLRLIRPTTTQALSNQLTKPPSTIMIVNMTLNEKAGMNPGGWIALAIMGGIFYAVAGWWGLIPIGIVVASIVLLPGMHKALQDDRQRKINARKMRRELRMENRMNLAQEYSRRHPDRA